MLNEQTLCRPILRCVLMAAFLVYFIVSAVTGGGGTSAMSHVGGFVCGSFQAFLFLPYLHSERWEQARDGNLYDHVLVCAVIHSCFTNKQRLDFSFALCHNRNAITMKGTFRANDSCTLLGNPEIRRTIGFVRWGSRAAAAVGRAAQSEENL